MADREIVFNLNIPLGAKRAEALRRMAQGVSIGEAVSGIATYLLEQQADGGVMLEPGAAARVRSALGRDVSSDAILQAVEQAKGREGETVVATLRLDPTYVPYFQQIADAQGRSIGELWQDMLNTAVEKGWIYDHIPPGIRPVFSREQMAELEELIGKRDLTGQDIYAYILEQAAPPALAKAEREDEGIFASAAAARAAGPEEEY